MTIAERTKRINATDLVAIDVHVHAMTVEKKQDGSTFGQSASKYFGADMADKGSEVLGSLLPRAQDGGGDFFGG